MLVLLQAMSDSGGEPVRVGYTDSPVRIAGVTFPSDINYTHRDVKNWHHAIKVLLDNDLVLCHSGDDIDLYEISALGYDYLDENSK